MSLHIGRRVDLRYHGRGHTNSDITIGVAGVLFAGDLVEESAPPAFDDAFPLDWPDALDRLLVCVDGVVVPGHGRPVDRAFVEQQKLDIAAVVELARAGFEEGKPAGEVELEGAPFPVEVAGAVVARSYAQMAGNL